MPTTEYKTVVARRRGFTLRYHLPDISGILNREAAEGWRLTQAVPRPWDNFLLILERERDQELAKEPAT